MKKKERMKRALTLAETERGEEKSALARIRMGWGGGKEAETANFQGPITVWPGE